MTKENKKIACPRCGDFPLWENDTRCISCGWEAGSNDQVNHPAHYNQGGIEVIEVIKLKSTCEEFIGYLQGNVLKYLLRYKYKGQQIQDLEKCRWYLERLTQEVAENLEEGGAKEENHDES